jgi:hypothetical protein
MSRGPGWPATSRATRAATGTATCCLVPRPPGPATQPPCAAPVLPSSTKSSSSARPSTRSSPLLTEQDDVAASARRHTGGSTPGLTARPQDGRRCSGPRWTWGAISRMLPRSPRGSAHALQTRCRAAPAGPFPGPPPDTVFRAARTAPVGPTHAVCAATGAVACGIKADRLQVLDQDWETACFVEKCPGCFAAVVTQS